jgi:hypothetical protein
MVRNGTEFREVKRGSWHIWHVFDEGQAVLRKYHNITTKSD